MNQKQMLLKAIEIFGSKSELGSKLGYVTKSRSATISYFLEGKGKLPEWRMERLKMLLERHRKKEKNFEPKPEMS